MNIQILKEIGLTEGETKVYAALLELGTTTTGPIIKKSGVSASKVYRILDKLAEKGFASHIIKAKTKYFRATDPERIIDFLDEKEKEIELKKEEIKKILPQLKAQLEAGEKREAEVYEGAKGVENIFWNIISELKKGEEYYVLGASYAFERYPVVEFFKEYHAERARRGIKVKIMFNYGTQFIIDEVKKLSEIKFMPQEIKAPIQIVIWRNKTSIILWQQKPLAFTIDSKEVAESFKLYFDALWNQDTLVTKGIEALNIALDNYLDGLGPDETYNVLGATFGFKDYSFYEKDYSEAFRRIHKKRLKKGIKAKLLFQQIDAKEIKKFLDEIYCGNNEAKILPYSTEFPVAILPSANQTLIIIHKKEPSMIAINNKEVSKAFKKYFDVMWEQDIKTYKGYDDFKRVWLETLDKGDVLYMIGAKGYYFDRRPKDAEDIVEAARKKGMKWKNVVDIGTKGHRVTTIEFAETRYFKEKITFPGVLWVCGDRAMISNWAKDEPIVIVMDDKDIADSYRNYFEILWGMAKP